MKKKISNTKFSDQAAVALKKQLVEALALVPTDMSTNAIWGATFDAARLSCKKYFGDYVGEGDINELIFYAIFDYRLQADPSKRDVFPEVKNDPTSLDEIADNIISHLRSLPRSYEVLFPLPKMRLSEDIVLSDTVSLITATTSDNSSFSGLLGINLPPSTYLKVASQGYVKSSRSQSGMQEAIAQVKRIVQAAVTKGIFIREPHPPGILQRAAASRSSGQSSAIVNDISNEYTSSTRITLGLGMSSYLDELVISQNDSSSNNFRRAVIRPDHISLDVRAALESPVVLLTSASWTSNAGALRSAFEWAFDATADDERVPSYIKTCIAIEAALGEDSDEGGITERLADRCAYLLCKTTTDRALTRERMRKIYRLRSKLVHGVQTALSHDDYEIESWAEIHLKMVLFLELKAVEEWHKRQPPLVD